MNFTVFCSSCIRPYSLFPSVFGLGQWVCLRLSYTGQSWRTCSAVSGACWHVHKVVLPSLNFVYIWWRSRLCPVLRRRMINCSGRLKPWYYWGFTKWRNHFLFLVIRDRHIWLLLRSTCFSQFVCILVTWYPTMGRYPLHFDRTVSANLVEDNL